MAETTLLSAGIDIGTTTTQLVFSRLTLADTARPGLPARLAITASVILYQSPVVFTPLKDSATIDVERLAAWLRSEYSAAGVEPRQVQTGAIIITGETARKENAEQVLYAIRDLAGEFVAALAGARLEAIIAGHGSGAAAYSRTHFCRVTNIDIGGGSANLAVFHCGELLTASAMSLGGRLIELDPHSGQVQQIAAPAGPVLEALGMQLSPGDRPALADLRRFTDCLADLVAILLRGETSALAQRLYLTPPCAQVGLPGETSEDLLMFSGGVGHYFYQPVAVDCLQAAAVHGDLGPLLAESLRQQPALRRSACLEPTSTLRATVLGASVHTVRLSGATIWVEARALPLRDLPVLRLSYRGIFPQEAWPTDCIAPDASGAREVPALAIDLPEALHYHDLTTLAAGLAQFADQVLPVGQPLVVILERDYARVLGLLLHPQIADRSLVVIDQVSSTEGDYVDIGLPVMDGRVVPVTVKTLAFVDCGG